MARDTDRPSPGEENDRPDAAATGNDADDGAHNVVEVVASNAIGSSGSGPAVRLLIPSSVRHLRLARVTASTMASDLSFDLQDIEDLRVAVDELAALLIEDCPSDAVLELSMQAAEGALRITGHVTVDGLSAPELHPVARELLDLLAGDYVLDSADGRRTFQLVKRPRSTSA